MDSSIKSTPGAIASDKGQANRVKKPPARYGKRKRIDNTPESAIGQFSDDESAEVVGKKTGRTTRSSNAKVQRVPH